MPYDVFFAGAGGTLLGTLVGAWISSRLTYGFQKKLLDQQLDFQKRQADADAAQRKALSDAQMEIMKTTRHVLRDLSNHVGSLNLNLAQSLTRRDQT